MPLFTFSWPFTGFYITKLPFYTLIYISNTFWYAHTIKHMQLITNKISTQGYWKQNNRYTNKL